MSDGQLPDPESMLRAARAGERESFVQRTSSGRFGPPPVEVEAATLSLTRRPHRDRYWAEGLLDALRNSGLTLDHLRCRHGSLLTERCMTGCPSNTLRVLLAEVFQYEVPGVYAPGWHPHLVGPG